VFYDIARIGGNTIKNQDDPTALNIPFVAENLEAKMFGKLEDSRFADGFAFDFRGDKERTINGTEGTLANSNQRDMKGFATTFQFERAIDVVGKMKLDWIFVKSYLTEPRDEHQSYRFAPHFSRTLGSVNYALETRLSDHDPITVDLPFQEPHVAAHER
jgi:hypothetical protein